MTTSRIPVSKSRTPSFFTHRLPRAVLCLIAPVMTLFAIDDTLFGQSPYRIRSVAESQPGKGIFLVADPHIDGGAFRRSVVLLLAHGEQGTLGLVVNRPTDIPLSKVLPEIANERESRELFFGGPVGLDNLIFLFRSDKEERGAAHVMDDVFFSGDRQVLRKVIGEKGRDSLRIYIGHSGWAPGQLDSEIARGDWRLVRADAKTVFGGNSERLWKTLSPPSPSSIVAGGYSARDHSLLKTTSEITLPTGSWFRDPPNAPISPLPASWVYFGLD